MEKFNFSSNFVFEILEMKFSKLLIHIFIWYIIPKSDFTIQLQITKNFDYINKVLFVFFITITQL